MQVPHATYDLSNLATGSYGSVQVTPAVRASVTMISRCESDRHRAGCGERRGA